MYDTVTTKQRQAASYAVSRSPDRRQWKSAEISPSQRLVQIDPERLEDYAVVTPKLEVVHHANDVSVAV